ncbi:hypothetical protein BAE44_0026213 [Dichanthelium oligosanthes]|uniref:Uncharacterized protein n=1 Tax=Dichanthelium oligosanthes TaxID=888268 RepID=A0A1E5UIS0_9POAL|nr:hypothetical protein BAE44_0026213 [Dichanthelium oligosanthes]
MAHGCPTTTTSSLLLFFILSCLIIGHALCNHGHHGRTSGSFPYTNTESQTRIGFGHNTGYLSSASRHGGSMPKERLGRRDEALRWGKEAEG